MTLPTKLPTWKILVVDDAFDNLEVLKIALNFYGAEVKTAQDGLHALDVLKTYLPNIILLDISMPQLNGWDTLKAIREDDRLRAVPVVAVTAHALRGDREKIMDAGFTDYIAKPFHIATAIPHIIDLMKTNKMPDPEALPDTEKTT